MGEWGWLLPLAALAAGWWIGRRGRPGATPDHTDHSVGYVEGLNYLLNEQPDRAIDVLVSMVEVDSETVATHLALGTLFRNKGEVDRAIRIHQNLIARPTLSKTQRNHALMDLGLDYKQAGLNDRAVALFEQLAGEVGPYQQPALNNLLDIYQYEKEWQQAITVVRNLLAKGSPEQTQLLSHFYAELADLAIEHNDLREAAKILRQIRGLAPHSPRYLLLQLKLAEKRGKPRVALRWLEQIISYCPDYRSQVLGQLEALVLATGTEDELLTRLNDLAEDPLSGVRLVCRIADVIERLRGAEAAQAMLGGQACRFSAPLATAKALALRQITCPTDQSDHALPDASGMFVALESSLAECRCTVCGFEAKEPHWRCPGCGAWDGLIFQEAS